MDQAAILRQITGQKSKAPDDAPGGKRGARQNKVSVISITSGKGGVGKTNITANMILRPLNAPLKSDGLRIIELPMVNVRYIYTYSCHVE